MQIYPKNIKQGDLLPALQVVISAEDSAGAQSVDLVLRSSKYAMTLSASPLSGGTWEHVWQEGETLPIGKYQVEAVATWSDGRKRTWPDKGYVSLSITQDLDLTDVPVVELPTELSYPVRSAGRPEDGDSLVWDNENNIWRPGAAGLDIEKVEKVVSAQKMEDHSNLTVNEAYPAPGNDLGMTQLLGLYDGDWFTDGGEIVGSLQLLFEGLNMAGETDAELRAMIEGLQLIVDAPKPPVKHDPTKAYPAGSLVLATVPVFDPETGEMASIPGVFLARTDVPVGIPVTDPEYHHPEWHDDEGNFIYWELLVNEGALLKFVQIMFLEVGGIITPIEERVTDLEATDVTLQDMIDGIKAIVEAPQPPVIYDEEQAYPEGAIVLFQTTTTDPGSGASVDALNPYIAKQNVPVGLSPTDPRNTINLGDYVYWEPLIGLLAFSQVITQIYGTIANNHAAINARVNQTNTDLAEIELTPGPKGDQGLPGVAGAKGDKGDPGSNASAGRPDTDRNGFTTHFGYSGYPSTYQSPQGGAFTFFTRFVAPKNLTAKSFTFGLAKVSNVASDLVSAAVYKVDSTGQGLDRVGYGANKTDLLTGSVGVRRVPFDVEANLIAGQVYYTALTILYTTSEAPFFTVLIPNDGTYLDGYAFGGDSKLSSFLYSVPDTTTPPPNIPFSLIVPWVYPFMGALRGDI